MAPATDQGTEGVNGRALDYLREIRQAVDALRLQQGIDHSRLDDVQWAADSLRDEFLSCRAEGQTDRVAMGRCIARIDGLTHRIGATEQSVNDIEKRVTKAEKCVDKAKHNAGLYGLFAALIPALISLAAAFKAWSTILKAAASASGGG